MRKNSRRAASSRYSRRRQNTPGRAVLRILKWMFLVCFVLALAGGVFALAKISDIIDEAPVLDEMMVTPSQAATYICNAAGEKRQKLTLAEANRDLVTIDRIPADLQHAFVAIEDARFYRHNGIDILGIFRAAWVGLRSGSFSEGASTITQQLLKNSVFTGWTQEKTFGQRLRRKIQEQYLALKLEKLLTKDQILEDYLNLINLGAGCYGVQSAAYRYFGKEVSDLTLSESAVIACITKNPTRYNPITNPENNSSRRQIVLAQMLRQGYISRPQYEQALADPVYERIQSNEDTADTASSVYTYYEDALIGQVIADLMEQKGYSYKQAFKSVYTGGLRIYSAQDEKIQKICDEEFANAENFPADSGFGLDYALSVEHGGGDVTHYGNADLLAWRRKTQPDFNLLFSTGEEAKALAAQFKQETVAQEDTVLGERITVTPQPQASAVIIDQASGLVRAIVGGRGEKQASLTLNRAVSTTRQPGSVFKILTAFAPAIDANAQTLATSYPNEEYFYEDGTRVSNWDISDYTPTATIREAIARSINVVAVECITAITPRKGYEYAKAFGITTLTDHYESSGQILSDVVQPLALGGITKGVTCSELCGAYACIANAGKYIRPRFYTQVLDHNGATVLDVSQVPARTVLKSSTAALLTSAMEDVIKDERGTAHGDIDLGKMPAAGKTGTTSDYRDIWFAGYTPWYTCCVWGGYDNNDCLPDVDKGHTFSKLLWNRIMNRVHEDLPVRPFPDPGNLMRIPICKTTGMAAAPGCPSYQEVFAAGTQPTLVCSVHGPGAAGTDTAGAPGLLPEPLPDTPGGEDIPLQPDQPQGQSGTGSADNGTQILPLPGAGSGSDSIWNEQNQPDIIILDN